MFELRHRCKEMSDMARAETKIDMKSQWVDNHGGCIRYIQFMFNDNKWVAHCDEYASLIEFCPFCGMKLPMQINVGTYKGKE